MKDFGWHQIAESFTWSIVEAVHVECKDARRHVE